MMIPNNYEINVAKKGKNELYQHYCKIELSCPYDNQAIEKFNELQQMFQANGDYKLELTKVTCYGEKIAG